MGNKKTYIKPTLENETFILQEYIATCYIVNCNVGSFDELWLESNGQRGLQREGSKYHPADTKVLEAEWFSSLHGCQEYHKGVTKNPKANGYIYKKGGWGGHYEEVFAWKENLGSEYDWHASLMNLQEWETNPNAS